MSRNDLTHHLATFSVILLFWAGFISVANADNWYRVSIGDDYAYAGPRPADDDQLRLDLGNVACPIIADNTGRYLCEVGLYPYNGAPTCAIADTAAHCERYADVQWLYSNGFNCGTGSYDPATGNCIADPPSQPEPDPDTPIDLSNKNLGDFPGCPKPFIANPIHAGTGNKFQTESDLSSTAPNGIRFVRYYNSFDDRVGVLGSNWRHNYERRVEVATDRSTTSVIRGDGKTFTYTPSGSSWVTDPDVTATMTETSTGWTYRMTSGTVEEFDTNGRLLSITDAQGRTQSLSYDAAGNLTSVTDVYGRTLTFTYDTQNRIAQMVTPDGARQFGYDGNNNLIQVTYPDTTTRQYLYENTSFVHALTGIIDENNNRYATWSYDAQGRATSSEHAGGADRVTLVYNADGTTTVTEANGQVRTFHFTTLHGVMKVTQIDGGPCTSCSGTSRLANYDANGFMSSKTDQNGNVTNYVNNARGLQTSRTEAVGTPEERTITTEWHASYSLPTRITEQGKVTDFTYDANGNLLSRTETDSTSSANRTTSYTYTTLGQILSSDGPRTDVNDVTTFAYDAEGNLTTVTNALGHVTRITAHDASGRPLSLTDPNGLVTNLAYDARGRVTSRDVGGEVTSFNYDPAGNITRVTLADGSYLDYHYDAAQRLTGIADQIGNRIDYQLDAAGNRTAESVFDSTGTLVRDRTHVYN
jgi:YD repeat-containing protein